MRSVVKAHGAQDALRVTGAFRAAGCLEAVGPVPSALPARRRCAQYSFSGCELGRMPNLHESSAMHLVTTRDAIRLTGLSTDQLREWTGRRALIPPDVKPKGHGSAAQYSWQTILLLRLAVTLRDRFKIELQAHRNLFSGLGDGLRKMSFLSLWGRAVALHGGDAWCLLNAAELSGTDDDLIVLRLDPHLHVLSGGFALPQPAALTQFQLFPATSVEADAVIALARKG